MTPEERAVDALDPEWFWKGMAHDTAVATVATAIRAAENDALERAAKMFLAWQDGYAAGKIRKLKHAVPSSSGDCNAPGLPKRT